MSTVYVDLPRGPGKASEWEQHDFKSESIIKKCTMPSTNAGLVEVVPRDLIAASRWNWRAMSALAGTPVLGDSLKH
jgi:hypothetical protein